MDVSQMDAHLAAAVVPAKDDHEKCRSEIEKLCDDCDGRGEMQRQ